MYYSLTEIAQAAGIFFVAIGAGIYGLKKNGLVTLGKPKERRNCASTCSEHTGLVKEVRANTIRLEKMDRKLDGVARDLNEAVGFIKAKTGGNL
ncbi:MAG: hypothetical protein ACYS1A_17925 [Planctomycetota bacterium]